jgi:hypothetical protein
MNETKTETTRPRSLLCPGQWSLRSPRPTLSVEPRSRQLFGDTAFGHTVGLKSHRVPVSGSQMDRSGAASIVVAAASVRAARWVVVLALALG